MLIFGGMIKKKLQEIKLKMTKTLLLTSSVDGQTVKIMKTIAQHMQLSDYNLIDLHDNNSVNLSHYDRVIIGASIRYGHFSKILYGFIDTHAEALNQMESYFFGVNLTARKAEKNTPETNSYMIKFLNKIAWRPKKSAVFAGAVRWSRYNFWQTKIIQLIMIITKGPKDPSVELEFTDWEKVKEFAALIR